MNPVWLAFASGVLIGLALAGVVWLIAQGDRRGRGDRVDTIDLSMPSARRRLRRHLKQTRADNRRAAAKQRHEIGVIR